MHGLSEGSVTCRIPRGETDPFLSRGIERDAVTMSGKRLQRSCGYDLAIRRLAVAPNQFDEFGGPGPVHVNGEGTVRARPLNGVIMQQNLAGGHKEVAGPK